MRNYVLALLILAAAVPVAAQAGGKHPPLHPSTCLHNCHPTVPPTVIPPSAKPPVQATPPLNTNEPREAYCVQTLQRGETFVQAGPNSFKPGGDWYALWKSEATVVLDGHTVKLLYENGKGVILAASVPGVGLTCAQPYVSTDGVYANPAYGLR